MGSRKTLTVYMYAYRVCGRGYRGHRPYDKHQFYYLCEGQLFLAWAQHTRDHGLPSAAGGVADDRVLI